VERGNKVLNELCFLSIAELARLYRAKTVSPVEVTDAALNQIERLNPHINAVVTVAADQARAQARRAEAAFVEPEPQCDLMCGVPVTIKDLIWTKDLPTEFGSILYRGYRPPEDAPAVARLKEAGAVILGKTATSELGWLGATHSQAHGITRNPWDLTRNTSGSSGGSAAAVACGIGAMSVGSDGGASIRAPAAYCGVVGLQPSYGRVPRWPLGLAYDLVFEGPLSRTVHDAAASLDVLARPDWRDWQSLPPPCASFLDELEAGVRGWRIAFSPDLGFAKVQNDVAAIIEDAAHAFTRLGARLVGAHPDIADPLDTYTPLWMPGRAKVVHDLGSERAARLDAGHRRQAALGQRVSMFDYMEAQERRHELCRRMQDFFKTHDLLLTPTLPDTAWEAGLDYPPGNPPDPPESLRRISLCYTFSLAHLPACSVPAGLSPQGLPVGLQIVGPRFAEARVLQAAAAFENERPWTHLRPPICTASH
jgi:aspartyl-tRNA(Asn)/glutamyl-tRNA(Gln) amidotransferase subunit A